MTAAMTRTVAGDTLPAVGTWALDPSHSSVAFSVRHLGLSKVRGRFSSFTGDVVIAEDPTRSSVDVAIEVTSIDTRDEKRDEHLRTNDFFDAETYPTIRFVSTDVSRDGDDWAITGDLTIKDVTKPVTVVFEQTGSAKDPFGNTRVGFEGETTVNRKDWGLTWNAALETGGVLVSEKIKLEFDVSAIRNA